MFDARHQLLSYTPSEPTSLTYQGVDTWDRLAAEIEHELQRRRATWLPGAAARLQRGWRGRI